MPEHSFFKTILLTALLTTGTALAAAPVPPDTTPSTQCSGNNLLEADGSCIDTSNVGSDNQGLPSVLSNDNSASQDLRINTDGQALELNSDNSNRDAIRFLESGTAKWRLDYTNEGLMFYDDNDNVNTLKMTAGNDVQIPNGNLAMNGQNVNNIDDIRGSTSSTDIYSNGGGRVLLRSRGSGGTLGWYDDHNNRWVQEYNNGGNLLLDPAGSVKLENANLNVNGNQLGNVQDIEMDGNIYGSGVDMSLQEVGSIVGPRNGDTDLNIQTQGSGSHQVSIVDGANNQDIARFHEGTQNVEIPNGDLDMSKNRLTSVGSISYRTENVNSQAYESFDGASIDGSTYDVSGDWGTWDNENGNSDIQIVGGYKGDAVRIDGGTDLISPNLNGNGQLNEWASSSGRIYLRAWVKTYNDNERARVHVSGDGGSSWTLVGDIDNEQGTNTEVGWQRVSYDLTQFISNGTDVRVQFDEAGGGGGDRMSIDNVRLVHQPGTGVWHDYNSEGGPDIAYSGGDVSLNNNGRIVDIQDPSNAQDAATKSYVDNNAGGDSQDLSEVLAAGNVANQTIEFSNGIEIGDSSTTVGSNTDAIAVGKAANASGTRASAVGYSALASGRRASGVGHDAYATGEKASAFGPVAAAAGDQASALGYHTSASANGAVAIGYDAYASAGSALSLGTASDASGTQAVAFGSYTDATGTRASAFGPLAQATAEGAVAIGDQAEAPNQYEATFGNLGSEKLDVNVTGDLTVHGSGGLDMEGNEITNVAEPDSGDDAANKNYVDNNTGRESGGAWSAWKVMGGSPTSLTCEAGEIVTGVGLSGRDTYPQTSCSQGASTQPNGDVCIRVRCTSLR